VSDRQILPTAGELGIAIRSARDIGDLLSAAMQHQGLIITAAELGPAFFDLRSGLAGETLQKLTNYGVQVAFVVPQASTYGARFGELAYEHRRHGLLRFFDSEPEARAWFARAQ
jgi:hypothetical protein